MTEARWLFGPEFESSEYASNLSLKNAVNKVFGVGSSVRDFPNWRKRPDFLMLAESTLSAVALEEMDPSGLSRIRKVLLLELKKGDSRIGRKELSQTQEYVDAIRNCGHVSGAFIIHSFVVGHRVDPSVTLDISMQTGGVEHTQIRGIYYAMLTQTASKRLFKLKERLKDRYAMASRGKRSSLLDELLRQQELDLTE